MMEIEAEHNPIVYFHKCDVVWEISAQKNDRNETQWWVFIIVIAVFTIFIVVSGSGFGYITAVVSIFGIVYLLNHRRKIYNAKKKYTSEAEEISRKYTENKKPIKWSFGEENFGYEDFQMSLNLNWSLFEKFEVKNDILFLFQSKDIQSAITIAKDEVGDENFFKIVEFVKAKLKK